MLRRTTVDVRAGDRLELWARAASAAGRGGDPLSLRAGGKLAFRIETLPPYFQFYAHTHYASEAVELVWDEDAIEISLFYRFNPATVAHVGVTFLDLRDGALVQHPKSEWPAWYAADASRPQLRFSPFRNWMNDPNGLCFVDGTYHLFYQFHPNGTDWGPMHWGHATSPDLYHWTHLPVFLHPTGNLASLGATGGAFSGNAFIDPKGDLSFYYTERLPAYDLFKDYKEVQKRLVPSADLLRPEASRHVLEYGPPGSAHDFRDPKVWYDVERGAYRMILGAAIDENPAVLLYHSQDGLDWTFLSVLYQAPEHFRKHGARCVECPDFLEIDGHWVLVMGFVGFTDPETGRHNLLYAATGTFADDAFRPYASELQELDFGTDYYAMQSFEAGDRQLALAWLFNWEFRKPAGSVYSGEMSLPRVLGIDDARRLTMLPEKGYQSLRLQAIEQSAPDRFRPEDGAPVELALRGELNGIRIVGKGPDGAEFVVAHDGGRLVVSVAEDKGDIVYRSAPLDLCQIAIFFDHGVLEIFANDGAVCGTRRSYGIVALQSIEIAGSADIGIATCEAWNYRSAWR